MGVAGFLLDRCKTLLEANQRFIGRMQTDLEQFRLDRLHFTLNCSIFTIA